MDESRLLALFRQAVREELGRQRPTLLTLSDAARQWRVSLRTVRRMVAQGRVMTVRVGVGAGSPRIPVSELRRLEVPLEPQGPAATTPRRRTFNPRTEAARIRALAKPRKP